MATNFYGAPGVWDGSEICCQTQKKVVIQVIGTPTTPYPIEAALITGQFSPAELVSLAGNDVTNGVISAAGWYYVEGNVSIRYAAGAGSTIVLAAF